MIREREPDRLEPLSIPLDVDDALRGAMQVVVPDEVGRKKKRKAKKKAKKRKAKRKKKAAP